MIGCWGVLVSLPARSPSGKATAFGAVIRWFESNPGRKIWEQLKFNRLSRY